MSKKESENKEIVASSQTQEEKKKKKARTQKVVIIVIALLVLVGGTLYVMNRDRILNGFDIAGWKDQSASLNDPNYKANRPNLEGATAMNQSDGGESSASVASPNVSNDGSKSSQAGTVGSEIKNVNEFKNVLAQNLEDFYASDGKFLSIPSIALLFDLASANVDNASLVKEYAKAYLQTDKKATILIRGYACDLGSDNSNMALSKNRAVAVKDILVSCGVEENRIEVKWFGETQYNKLGYPAREDYRRVNVLIK